VCEEKRSCHLRPLYLTLIWRKKGSEFLCQLLVALVLGVLIAAAEEMQTVWDEYVRLQNAMALLVAH